MQLHKFLKPYRISLTSIVGTSLLIGSGSCLQASEIEIYETNRSGAHLQAAALQPASDNSAIPVYSIAVDTENPKQTIEGFGSSLTESTAYVLGLLSPEKRTEVLHSCFSEDGARYSLTRTHIASCDFSLSNYTYAVDPKADLSDFSLKQDENDLIPLIQDALAQPGADLKIMASPWTAPPWMKDNQDWNAGSLLPEHYETFSRYLVKYFQGYANHGIEIWGMTPENEPHGNGGQWESMHFTAEQMAQFIAKNLGPDLQLAGLNTKIFIFDQNRDNVLEFIEPILHNPDTRKFVDGIALHWYSATKDYCPETLDTIATKFPEVPFFQSEGCIDVMGDDEPAGVWLKDDWYWSEDATDWGYYWAEGEAKADHPKYRPFYRYVRDIIGGLNHGFFAWIDWNLALDFKGGPNHANNFCGAPILVDGDNDTIYYTPLFYGLQHFSKFIRPGARVLPVEGSIDENLMVTAAQNPDGSLVIVAFNMTEKPAHASYSIAGQIVDDTLNPQSLKTYILHQ